MLWFEWEHMKVYWDVALIYIAWSQCLFYPQKQNKTTTTKIQNKYST